MAKIFVGALWPKSLTYLGFGGSQKLGFSGVCSKCGQIRFCSKMWEKVWLGVYGQNRQPIWDLGVLKKWRNPGKLNLKGNPKRGFTGQLRAPTETNTPGSRWSLMAKLSKISRIWGSSKNDQKFSKLNLKGISSKLKKWRNPGKLKYRD